MKRLTAVMTPVLALLSLVYAGVMKTRAWFYHVRVFPSDSCGSFVVSIGNLQAGGTGKTPVTAYLARRWKTRLRLGIVSRGYGRQTRGSLQVVGGDPDASAKYGDEPTWFARSLENVPVQVGERRLTAAQDLVLREGVGLLLLDDGFQHMALRRSYDIVLLDVSAPEWHWRVLPWGRMREPWSALQRADFVILTKTESVESSILEGIEAQIRTIVSSIPIVRFAQKISWVKETSNEVLVLAAGLARPESFYEMVRSHGSKPRIAETVTYPDHHRFLASDVAHLKACAGRAGANRVLVTAKDGVKLQALWNEVAKDSNVKLVIAELEVGPVRELDEKQLERLDEVILGQVRGANRSRGELSPGESSSSR